MLRKILLIFFVLSITCNASETVTIIYTQNSNGQLENCKCPSHAYGALEKRATVIDSVRKNDLNVIAVETGDAFGIGLNPKRHMYITRVFNLLNYDYFVPGDQDFVEGCDYLLEEFLPKFRKILSTNISVNNTAIGDKFDIKQIGDIRIAFTATMDPKIKKYISPYYKCTFDISDQYKSLTPVINTLKKQSDFLVLLSHSGFDRDREVAHKYPEIDLIIGGHSQTILNEPEKVGNTLIVQAGENGYRVGILKLYFENKKLVNFENKLVLLDDSIDNHPEIMKIIEEYLGSLGKKLNKNVR